MTAKLVKNFVFVFFLALLFFYFSTAIMVATKKELPPKDAQVFRNVLVKS
jgi:hypothetical protein